MDDVLAEADRNMRENWAAVARVAGGEATERDGFLLVRSGVPIALFNPAFALGPDADLETVRAHYDVPFVVYWREVLAPTLADACTAAGLVEYFQPPLMVLDPIPAADADAGAGAGEPPCAIEVVDRTNFDAYLDVLCRGFGIPSELVAPAFKPELVDVEGFTGFLGRDPQTNDPAAASGLYLTGDIAGVYNVATVPEHRRKGYGEALTAAAARHGAELGATRSILQASGAGEPVYARMGYTTPARYRQFEPADAG